MTTRLPDPSTLPRLDTSGPSLNQAADHGFVRIGTRAFTLNVIATFPDRSDPNQQFVLSWLAGARSTSDPVDLAERMDALDVLSAQGHLPPIRSWARTVSELAGPVPTIPSAWPSQDQRSRFASLAAAACLLEQWRLTGDNTAGEVLAGRQDLPALADASSGLDWQSRTRMQPSASDADVGER